MKICSLEMGALRDKSNEQMNELGRKHTGIVQAGAYYSASRLKSITGNGDDHLTVMVVPNTYLYATLFKNLSLMRLRRF